MAYEDLMVTKIGYQQLDNTLACSRLQDSGKANPKISAKNRVRTGKRGFHDVSLVYTFSETQGQSVGSGEKARRKFSSTGKRAPGYRLSLNYFQKFKQMPALDWAQKMLCIIVPNRRTVSSEFFSWVRTRRLLYRSRLVWLMHQRNARSQEFSLI